jgi:hypothetical protein
LTTSVCRRPWPGSPRWSIRRARHG